MRKTFLILFLILSSVIILPQRDYAEDIIGEELKLYMGEVKLLSVNNPTRIIIGNPNIADVSAVGLSEITLSPKTVGTTTFSFRDNFGEQNFQIKVYREDMSLVQRRVDNLLSKLNFLGVYTKAEDEENKVFILGKVKTAQDREMIALALGPLKDKTIDLIEVKEEEAVVEISVEVLELDKGVTSTMGFTWPGSLNLIERNSSGLATTGTKWSTLFTVTDLQRATSDGATPWTFKLDALIQEGKARILSRPHLACQSGKEAELLVGGEKPIFTTEVASAGGEGTNVEYKEYGLKLKIKPVVNDENRIKLALNIEVSEVGTAEFIGSTSNRTAQAYPLTRRNASTELFLDDGQMMAIGGIIKQKTSEEVRKVPWLAEVPVLGLFFRQKSTTSGDGYSSKGDTELFITLTPKIVIAKTDMPKKSEEAVVKPEPVNPLTTYAGLIQKYILERLAYPKSAKESGLQGTVKLGLHISSDGELLEAVIETSSGNKILDDNAMNTAKGITAYPAFPSSVELQDIWVQIPITYQLD